MAEVIKTQYMDKPQRGYSEYIARNYKALEKIPPKEGDRAMLLNGELYVCLDAGKWERLGG